MRFLDLAVEELDPDLVRRAGLVAISIPMHTAIRIGVEAGRGCAHRCRHCPVPAVYEGRLRIVQRAVVLEDVANLVAMGPGHISFGDPDFLNGVGHSLAIAREMDRRHPGLTFDYTAKIEHLLEHPGAVAELAELGCVFVLSAVETIDDDILERLDKGHTRADVVEALGVTREAGVALRPSLLPFTPWTTPSGYVELLDFVAEHDLVYHVSPVQFSIRLLLPPGSWLLDRDDVRAQVTGRVPEDFAYAWEHPDPRVDRLQERVAEVVRSASATDEDPGRTFRRIRELAHAADPDASAAPAPEAPAASGPRPPRLSEDWFHCAEPTEDQFGAVCQG